MTRVAPTPIRITPSSAPLEAMVAKQQSNIDELVTRNRSLEQTISKLKADLVAERSKTEAAVQQLQQQHKVEQAEWREGCDSLQGLWRVAHLRTVVDLEKERTLSLRLKEDLRLEKLARLQRDFQIGQFQAREGELEDRVQELALDNVVKDRRLSEELSTLEETVQALRKDVKERDEQLEETLQSKKQLEKMLAALRKDHAALLAASSSNSADLERTNLQVDGLKSSLAEWQDKYNELQLKNADLLRQLEKWRNIEEREGGELETTRIFASSPSALQNAQPAALGASEQLFPLPTTSTSTSSLPTITTVTSTRHGSAEDGAQDDTSVSDSEPVEPTEPQSGKSTRTKRKFSSNELEELIRVTIQRNPWAAKHKEKGKAWDEVRATLQSTGLCEGTSSATLRNKVENMIKWHTDPESGAGKTMANELSPGSMITLSALVDRAYLLKVDAQNMTDAQKEKARKKDEEDRVGGEAIRNAALTVFRKRKSDGRTTPASTDVSDAENEDPTTPRKKKKTHRVSRSGSSALNALEREERDIEFSRRMLELMERSERRQEEMQKQMLDVLRESQRTTAEAYERVAVTILGALKDIVCADSRNSE